MLSYQIPELTPEENRLPLAHFYYDYPLYYPDPRLQQILDTGPMDPQDAIPAQNWLDLLQITGYRDVVYGYCMMPDGSGFYIQYHVTDPRLKPGVRRWYGKWVNFHSKNMPEGCGNLRAKIWNPLDHWEHKYVNGKDASDGIWTLETLDMGASGGGRFGVPSIVHDIDLSECGLTPEKQKELTDNGCRASACWEEFEGPGHHLVLRFSRPCPLGGTENINCEWIGYFVRDGKVVRDPDTPVTEEYLRNVLWHNTIERVHLEQVLPELYETYHDLPLDAD